MSLPMLLLNGNVDNVFKSQEGVDKKTGAAYGGRYIAQLISLIPLDNGDTRKGLVDVNVDDHHLYFRDMVGHDVSLPVLAFANGNKVGYSILRSWRPPRTTTPPNVAGMDDVA